MSEVSTVEEALDLYGDLLARACVVMYRYDPMLFGSWAGTVVEKGYLTEDEAMGLLDSIADEEKEEEDEPGGD
jgi:hypothetical protein